MQDVLRDLNDEQRQVVQATEGPVLVMAGAGSGKTRALTHRIAYLMQRRLAHPSEILAVTFTNKAAAEMKKRVAELLSAFPPPRGISTFHALGAKILREWPGVFQRSRGFTILDEADSTRLTKEAMKRLSLTNRLRSAGSVKVALSRAKGAGQVPEGEDLRLIGEEYERLLSAHDAFDFDDLLWRPVQLLTQQAEVRRTLRGRWRYISVDEYQDTNALQVRLLELLLNEKRNLCVVGDDYQAIYSWRGAEVDHIRRFPEQFPGATTLYLTQNYRSTPQVLAAANAIMAAQDAAARQLWTRRADGGEVEIVACASDRHEAAWMRQMIQAHVGSGGKLSDCAVLYRTNAQSRVFEEEFLRAEIPYTVVGGFRFYERREVKDVLALLMLSLNPNAALARERVAAALWRGVGPKTLARWEEPATKRSLSVRADIQKTLRACQAAHRKKFATVGETLRFLVQASGYGAWLAGQADGQERQENIEELSNVASVYQDATEFLETVALLTDLDRTPPEARDRVTCMTLHAAKGLEFPMVFLVGCEEGLLPHVNSLTSTAALEEERRLFYVGMTRARDELRLSYARQRLIHGSVTLSLPSRFLQALPQEEVYDTTFAD